ncbi:MAG: radical SAM protein [Candidatus Methylomirabilis sp.]|nr:radical SAM protein [Deltaproteobacteria bacterium]
MWWKKDGKVLSTPKRPAIEDIDSLPFPDKTIFERDVNIGDDYIILTSRGCVLSCTFCCENYINKTYGHSYYRRRSVENVMAELRLAKSRYGFREVMFNDAIFFTDKEWLRRLAPAYKREIGVPFRCFGQVKFIDAEVGELLREMGCYCIEYGVQTLNEAVRNFVLARTESNTENTHAMAICDKYGIRYDVDHIFGLPEEREEDFVQAARYYRKRRYLNRIKCHNLTYFPQTEMVEIARKKGLIDDAEVERINRGEVGDFFHGRTVDRDDAERWARRYQTLFKVLPVTPAFALEWLLKDGRLRHLEKVPSPAVILGQILVAIRGRDYRFVLYVKYYFWRLRRWAVKRWLPERA